MKGLPIWRQQGAASPCLIKCQKPCLVLRGPRLTEEDEKALSESLKNHTDRIMLVESMESKIEFVPFPLNNIARRARNF